MGKIQLYDLDKDLLIKRPVTASDYKEAIEKLERDLEKSHKDFIELSTRLDKYRIKYLEKFKESFTLYCIIKLTNIDLIQCAETNCKFRNECKPRRLLIQKFKLGTGE